MSRLVPVDLIDPSPFSHLSPPDEENQQQIAEDLERTGEVLVPLHVVKTDGDRWELLAGHDRLEAAKLAGLSEVPVRDFSGTVVTEEEKASHVLRENNLRKGAPKRPGVEWWLERHPEWSNRRIAEEVGCSHPFVGAVRSDMEAAGMVETVSTREGQDGVRQPARKPPAPKAPSTTSSASAPTTRKESVEQRMRREREEQFAGHDPRLPEDDTPAEQPEPSEAGSGASPATTESVAPNDDVRSEEEVIKRRPYTSKMQAFIRAAVSLGEPSDEEVEAIPVNDIMLDGLRKAHATLDRIISTHRSTA